MMWSALEPQTVATSEQSCDRLLQLYEMQIQELEVLCPIPNWDGHCGLVKVCEDGDLLQQRPPSRRASDAVGSSAESPHTSQHTAVPAAGPGSAASPQQLAQHGEQLLAQGQPQQARAVLQSALQACSLHQVEEADAVISLLLEAEQRMAVATCSIGSQSSQLGAGGEGGPALPGPQPNAGLLLHRQPADAAVHRELLLALEALARNVPRRALQHLQRAQAACPAHATQELRRVELYRQLIQCKRHL